MATIALRPARAPHLLKLLGIVFGFAIGVGSMIGAGILRTPGAVAELVPSLWWIVGLWAFGGVHALLGANIVAELATSIPKAGGLYVPVRRAFGDLAAMVVGCGDILSIAAATAALAIAGSEFLALAAPAAANWKISFAVALIFGLLVINALGLREGRAAQIVTTALKLALLVAIIAAAIALPSVPVATIVGAAPALGLAAALAAYQLVYGAYTGWTTPAYFVEEDVAPSRNIPRALMFSLIAVTAVYLALNLVLLRAIPVAELGQMDIPVGELLGQLFGRAGAAILGLTGFIIILSCCNALTMQAPRIIYGLARDGLFPRHGMLVNRGGTPWMGLLVFGIGAIAMTATGSFEAAFRLMGALTLVILIAVDLSIFVLRHREPDLDRPFSALGFPFLPLAALVLDVAVTVAIVWFDPMSGFAALALLSVAAAAWLLTARFRIPAEAV